MKEESCHLEGFIFKYPKNICSVNASRECHGWGRWAETTNYNHCLCNSTDATTCALDTAADTNTPALEISIIIYLIGETSVHNHATLDRDKNTFDQQLALSIKHVCLFTDRRILLKITLRPKEKKIMFSVILGTRLRCNPTYHTWLQSA